MSLTLLHKIVATVLGCAFFIIVLRLVRRKRLDTALSVWWIAASLVIIALAWCDKSLRLLALRMALEISSVMLVSGIFYLLFTCLHMSASITRLSQQIRQIGQVIALNNIQKSRKRLTNKQTDQKPEHNSKSNCVCQNKNPASK